MALTVPTQEALLTHMHQTAFTEDILPAWVDDALQQATDIMYIATNLTQDPADAQMNRIIQTGILAMAHYLLVTDDDRDEMYSPFASEHLGSYGYSKMMQSALTGGATGVPFFDLAVRAIESGAGPDGQTALVGISNERVFDPRNQGYKRLRREQDSNLTWTIDIYGAPDASRGDVDGSALGNPWPSGDIDGL